MDHNTNYEFTSRDVLLQVWAPKVIGALVILVAAVGLRSMSIADDSVLLVFGLILGAAALAFGLGGREAANKVAKNWAYKVTRKTDRV